MNLRLAATLLISLSLHAQDDFPLTEESKPQPNVPKGQMLKDTYTAHDGSVFPGTEREYQIYVPANLDTTKPAPFMVFQDGVIYNAPTVFDNLIAKKDLPPMIGIFIKPGVVPAANENALPRFNRSYEYDSVTDTYSRFLIDEFLPAIVAKHQLNLSTDPNARGISGNSSGGICAFMVAWHRPDQFRRVFTGVGTYVGIHGADQLAVLVRKHEPKPLRVFLQSGENDNNLYCGDWWMANQMMERSLTWNGYDVNHAWGKGGHNAKHASQIFPDVLRWLWKGYPEEPVKANPSGDAKWRGYEVIGAGEWLPVVADIRGMLGEFTGGLTADAKGNVIYSDTQGIRCISTAGKVSDCFNSKASGLSNLERLALSKDGKLHASLSWEAFDPSVVTIHENGEVKRVDGPFQGSFDDIAIRHDGRIYLAIQERDSGSVWAQTTESWVASYFLTVPRSPEYLGNVTDKRRLAFTPDQTGIYSGTRMSSIIELHQVGDSGTPFNSPHAQAFGTLETVSGVVPGVLGLCVDTNGWLYVATSLGIQVLDQAGRVNFIIPTPKQPHDVCFGGKGLSELFIACGDTIYKRPTKAKGYISGQMAPIKPPAPKL